MKIELERIVQDLLEFAPDEAAQDQILGALCRLCELQRDQDFQLFGSGECHEPKGSSPLLVRGATG